MSSRHTLFRVSIVASLVLLACLGLYSFSSSYPSVGKMDRLFSKSDKQETSNEDRRTITGSMVSLERTTAAPDAVVEAEINVNDASMNVTKSSGPPSFNDPALAQEGHKQVNQNTCRGDLGSAFYMGQRGPYWVLYNYVKASRQFGCEESITYTTHADYTFLDNLVPLLDRWQGPVSISLYCPGMDYVETLKRIQYLRECSSPLVKELVTFHLFFDREHIPLHLTQGRWEKLEKSPVNCRLKPEFGDKIVTFKKHNNMPYPVNVGRNVAREMAQTHYVLASDIELYPNPNLIQNFLTMIRRNDTEIRVRGPNAKVFVLPIFELEANVGSLPYDKAELQSMLHKSIAIPFHKYVCSGCHTIPKQKEWMEAKMKPGLSVFHTGKRQHPYQHWEPFYIGTKLDPVYDERLTWEGRRDKMTQGFVLCVLDYDFHILDTAFLVHRPGIKRITTRMFPRAVAAQDQMIATTIMPELILLYGSRTGCQA